jgi:tetratricopeptide (TPR) repeat protein
MVSSILKQALALHRAGKLSEAAKLYRRGLRADPGNPDALHFLGLVAHQSGRYEEAVDLIRQAIARRPKSAYWYNIAHVHLALKDMPRAEEAFRQAIAIEPRHAEALFHLGCIASRSDDFAGATDFYRQAIDAKPEFTDARVNLGLLLNRVGDAAGAIREFEEALRLRPNDPEIHNNIGIARAGVAPTEAIEDFQRALSLSPEHTGAKVNLAKLLASMSRHADAVEVLSSVLVDRPEDADTQLLLASSLAELNRPSDAVRHFEFAAAAMPRSVRPLLSLGNLYLRFGRFDDAYDCYLRVRGIDPQNCDALVGILKHRKSQTSDEEAERVARLAEDVSLPIPERRRLHFALSACREAQGDYDTAFLHMDCGNQLRRMELEPQSGPYDPAKQIARVDGIIETFNEDYFRRVAGFGVASELPVFVVGMPRSGTTLCEQILASHPTVYGADELPDMSRIERELMNRHSERGAGSDDAGYAVHLTPDIVQSIAESQLHRLQNLAPRASRIVDKMPMNYYRLGLIATLFPKAKIIHCLRDPMDTGLSCYSKDFVSFPLWASDLRSIGQTYRQHDRLMAHWRRVLPIDVLEFRYESVVGDLERSARNLIEYCGLEWEDACLEFYRTDRQVKTASLEQVRRPIYDTSIGRWRKFERHLAPLYEALNKI